jgi:acyl carrier protein phosphodiesterase
MNHLAHLRLAAPEGNARIGGLIGDFVKGDLAGLFPPDIEIEARLHRRIDSMTDAHPFVRSAKRAFPEALRRFAPIALDIYWDHLLLRRWAELSREPLDAFEARTHEILRESRPLAPEPLRTMIPHMLEARFLRASASMDGVARAIGRVASGWRHGERLAACIAFLPSPTPEAEESFAAFYRDLEQRVSTERAALRGADAGRRAERGNR